MCNIYNFGFDTCFTISLVLSTTFAKLSFDKAKITIDYKNLISVEVNFFEHTVPVLISNRYRKKKKRKLNKQMT